MRVARSIFLSALLLISSGTREALACTCASSGPPCQNAFQVDAIFAGTVRSITALADDDVAPLRAGEAPIASTVRVDFADVEGYRGVQAATLSVVTPGSGPACGYAFKPGERYLVYARRKTGGADLVTSICTRTRSLADAAEDLRFLQTLAQPSPLRARVYGTINHREHTLASGQPKNYGPVSDVFVSVVGSGGTFGASTDDQGRYEMMVPPGKYEVTALPGAAYSASYPHEVIELRDTRACAVVDVTLRFDSRIRGQVRQSSGEPAANVTVQMVAAEDVGKSGNIQTLSVESDPGGSFEFSRVSPGRYVVGVDLTRRMDPKVVFPSTFYPGTANPGMATVINVDGGERHELDPLTLPSARRSFRLTGTVRHGDGSPAGGVSIFLSDGIEKWRQVAAGTKTEFDGAFSFVVYEGLSYIARALYWDEAQRKQIAGQLGPFLATPDAGPIQVMLTGGR